MPELFIRKSIEVHAQAEALWKVLTENEFITQYMFGCVAETDWKPGSRLLWKGAADGKLYVKGQVVAVDAPWRLEYTVIDPNNSAFPDIPENYLTMIYEIRKRSEGGATFEIIQGDYSKVAEGQKRYEDTLKGDDFILVKIKELAEGLQVAAFS
ncbi:SRPBCC domain-containing protein [Alloacidobacterium dinghuense]|uniref:SRPBCC domain-containing protein n=1 Tax=Alloacidobacterium dinghuense TaxID=2763107 RepID=A0A7G8BG57_9BACT|nr:SRPBCC domain-containing protein [Alloacidobacterium dinghuense]QNI31527.1 SRPBCC domain-containing protein [Alloacidobacterium dinghuense]